MRRQFLGNEFLAEAIRTTEGLVETTKAELESISALRAELNRDSKNESFAGGRHRDCIKYLVRLAGLKSATGASVSEVRGHFHEAGSLFLTVARNCDFAPKVVEFLVYGAEAKKYAGKEGVEVLSAEEKGWKKVRTTVPRQPAFLSFGPGLQAALISGDWHLASEIAQTYRTTRRSAESVLQLLVLGDERLAAEHANLFNPKLRADADFPGGRHQFPVGIIQNNATLIADGISNVTGAFKQRWKAARYLTPSMLSRLGTPDEALAKARQFLVDMRWLLYEFGIVHCVVAYRRGMTGVFRGATKWSEWIPEELAKISAGVS